MVIGMAAGSGDGEVSCVMGGGCTKSTGRFAVAWWFVVEVGNEMKCPKRANVRLTHLSLTSHTHPFADILCDALRMVHE